MAEAFLGEIRLFGGNYAPVDWMICDGRTLSISEYSTLYALIGITYGGDGTTNFKIPDLRGRAPIGQGNMGGILFPMGEMPGSESVTLSSAELPSHTHTAMSIAEGTTTSPENNDWGGGGVSIKTYSTSATSGQMNPTSLNPIGGNGAHENRVPYRVINYIICVQGGIWPSQN
jgi:microcystin-dependent protein